MQSNTDSNAHVCPVCQFTWEGQGDYCPACKSPLSEAAIAAQDADARGCQFFMLMITACFFGFIGIALTVVGITAKSHDDPVAAKFFFGGLSIVSLCVLAGYFVWRKFGAGATAAGRSFEREAKTK